MENANKVVGEDEAKKLCSVNKNNRRRGLFNALGLKAKISSTGNRPKPHLICSKSRSLKALVDHDKSPRVRTASPKAGNQSDSGPANELVREKVSRTPKDRETTQKEARMDQRERTRKARTSRRKSLEQIIPERVYDNRSDCRSKRKPKKMMSVREESSQATLAAASIGTDLNDSQIVNMNCIFCNQESNQLEKEFCPTPGQIWGFLDQIGIKRNCTEDEIIQRIQEME
ncbi:hypothetical protein Ancab_034177 [Ancistrocladus abbreviatus]